MVITKLALPRRTFIRGIGATVALPFLDAMVPAMRAQAKAAPRFTAIYCGNGANMFDWTPSTEGVGFAMSPSLTPLEPFRDRLVVFTGLDNFQATDQGDVGGQHPRAAPAFMSCAHPKQTEGADVQAGTTIDQMIADRICRDTKLPSLEVSVDRQGGQIHLWRIVSPNRKFNAALCGLHGIISMKAFSRYIGQTALDTSRSC
jgi:hypothetical protein